MAGQQPFLFSFDVKPDDDEDNYDDGDDMNNDAAVQNTAAPKPFAFSRPCHEVPFVQMPRAIGVDRVPLPGTADVLYRRSVVDVEENVPAGSALATSSLSQSDLIPGVYEGGVKTWECAYDLVATLLSYLPTDCTGLRVLEVCMVLARDLNARVIQLGCGSALPALVALLRNATVCLQDYNDEVITQVTWPNVLLNCDRRLRPVLDGASRTATVRIDLPPQPPADLPVQLIGGSWDTLHTVLPPASFDIILMSETIYDPTHYQTLVQLLRTLLKPGGSALIAAKVYYFGIGGNTAQFRQELQSSNSFVLETLLAQSETVRREIIKATLFVG